MQLHQQVQMCTELLRELWGSGTAANAVPSQPHLTDFWLPDFGDDADVPAEVRERVRRAANAETVVSEAEAEVAAGAETVAPGHAAASAMLRVVCNDLDRRMATPDGELKAMVTVREANLARRAYTARARIARAADSNVLALLNACRAVAFGLRSVDAYREALYCAVAAGAHTLAEDLARHGLAVARLSPNANDANAFRAKALALVAVSARKKAAATGGNAGAAALARTSASNNQVALPKGVSHSREEPPAMLHEKLDNAVLVLRGIWADSVAANEGKQPWLPDWIESAAGMGATPASVRELSTLSPSQLKDRGNDAWKAFASSGDAADAEAARLCYTSCIAKLDVAARIIEAARDVPGAPERLGLAEMSPSPASEGAAETGVAATSGTTTDDLTSMTQSSTAARRTASAAFMNRSLVHMQTRRDLPALLDAVFATVHDPASLKAHYRGLVAAQNAGDIPLAVRFCQAGLRLNGASDETFSKAAADLACAVKQR